MSDPLGPVSITAREIYDRVVLIGALVERVSLQLTDLASRASDHEQRLRRLESGRWPLPALAALLSLAAIALPFLIKP